MNNKSSSGTILTLMISLVLNLLWSIPAWVLLILHFAIGLSIVWFWVALGIWALLIVVSSLLIRFAHKYSNMPELERENLNPYSHKDSDFNTKKKSGENK